MQKCPKCADHVLDDATMCAACGYAFSMFSTQKILMIVAAGAALFFGAQSLIDSFPKKKPVIVQLPPRTFTARNSFAEQIPALAGEARAALFGKMMKRSGETCDTVKKSFFLGTRDGLAYWNIRCEGSGDWMVQIKGDASITRVACAAHHEIRAQCWKPL